MKPTRVEISRRTIIFTVFFLLGLYVAWTVRELFISLFIAFMIMSVVKPVVVRLARHRVPRGLSTFVIFALLLFLLSLGLWFILPSFLSDMTSLLRNLSTLIDELDPAVKQYLNIRSLNSYLPNLTSQVVPFIQNVFSNIVFLITTLFFSIYFILDDNFLERFLQTFLKKEEVQRVVRIAENMEKRLGAWFYAEIILMTIIGFLTYVGLTLIGVRHALSLAVIAGLLEALPVVGPIISAIPAFIFAVNQRLILGVGTLGLYIFIQQLENNLLVPTVMKKAVGLNKILILVVLVLGGKLGGVMGLFIAIPVTLCIESILSERTRNGLS